MNAVSSLPEGYKEYYKVDLQKDKKTSLAVNLAALLIAAAMVALMCLFVPISNLFDFENGSFIIRYAALLVFMVVYMILHEFVHGIAMKLCGTKKVKYGFTGLYAFAGSDDYYGKKPYIFIALAPVVLWGAIIAAINAFVPEEWFWIVYFIQIINISGAAGDLFVTFKFLKFPEDILVKDHGVGMTVYSKV